MKAARAKLILRCLRQAARPDDGLTDGELLGRYVTRRDGGAFEALVRRHGPMVLSVCRRVLRHAQDAEDAFQAAFLILAKKAASVGDREAVAAWLYKVAYHAALEAQASRRRRKARERQVEDMPHQIVMPEDNQGELLALLDRELARLPERHRLPLVLCELEGRSRKEAARQLGLAEGTLSSRLARGRKMLARRMAAHGGAVAAASASALLSGGARAACVPPALAVSTVGAVGGVVHAGVAALVKGVMKAMLLSKLKGAVWALLIVAAVSVGAATWTYRASAQPAPDPQARPGASAGGGAPALGPGGLARASWTDDLEALRLEVEALRLELKATKERVRALEERAQGPGTGAGTGAGFQPGFGPGTPGGRYIGLPGGAPPAPPGGSDAGPAEGGAFPPGAPGGRLVAPPHDGQDQLAALEAAIQELRRRPTDKDALEAIERAIQALKAPASKERPW